MVRGRVDLARVLWMAALLQAAACGDDDTSEMTSPVGGGDGSTPAAIADAGGATPSDAASGLDAARDGAATVDAATSTQIDAAADSGTKAPTSDGATATDGGSVSDAKGGLTLPSVLSLETCGELDVSPLCSVVQSGSTFTANCGGAKYSGTIAADGAVQFTAPETTTVDGAKVNLTCSGKLELSGTLSLTCKQTTSAVAMTPAEELTCKVEADGKTLPGVSCMELPAQLTDVVVCKEGAAQAGTTVTAGSCKVIQDGCAFQAECANNVVLSGTVSKTGVRFVQPLKALADAATPAMGMPAFTKGTEVNHTCTGMIQGGKLTGSCSAGQVRGMMATSVCTMEGNGTAPAVCAPIAPKPEQLFVLDSCELLENGEGAMPGIGEPVCALRQNGCIWDLQCGQNPLTKFSGRLEQGATKVSWRLATGTPCELSVDAAGAVSGKCTVPGQTACELKSKPAVAGAMDCPALPPGNNIKSHGCGGGDPLMCREALQHGCNYMALCNFTASNDLLVAGKTSLPAGRPRFEFQGLGDYSCRVDKSTDAEVASGDRVAQEWYGQCTTPSGGMCRDNYNAATKSGFRGLRLYFDLPAGTPFPPGAPPPMAPAPAPMTPAPAPMTPAPTTP
jgi:hypothetical protein